MRGFLVGAFTLIVVQVLVSHSNATNAVGGIAKGVGSFVDGFIDPNTPAIPDHTATKATPAVAVTPAAGGAAIAGSPPGNTGTGFVPGEV